MNNGQPSRGRKWLALKELEKKSAQCSSLPWGGKQVSSCVLARQLPGCKTRAASASLICLSNHRLRRKPPSMGGYRQRVFISRESWASPPQPRCVWWVRDKRRTFLSQMMDTWEHMSNPWELWPLVLLLPEHFVCTWFSSHVAALHESLRWGLTLSNLRTNIGWPNTI